MEKKKNKNKKAGKEELKPVRKFLDNFTTINARAAEVLAVIRGDPKFCRPPQPSRQQR
jgi:hypothetical protein